MCHWQKNTQLLCVILPMVISFLPFALHPLQCWIAIVWEKNCLLLLKSIYINRKDVLLVNVHVLYTFYSKQSLQPIVRKVLPVKTLKQRLQSCSMFDKSDPQVHLLDQLLPNVLVFSDALNGLGTNLFSCLADTI